MVKLGYGCTFEWLCSLEMVKFSWRMYEACSHESEHVHFLATVSGRWRCRSRHAILIMPQWLPRPFGESADPICRQYLPAIFSWFSYSAKFTAADGRCNRVALKDITLSRVPSEARAKLRHFACCRKFTGMKLCLWQLVIDGSCMPNKETQVVVIWSVLEESPLRPPWQMSEPLGQFWMLTGAQLCDR